MCCIAAAEILNQFRRLVLVMLAEALNTSTQVLTSHPTGKYCSTPGTTEETLKDCTAGFICESGCSRGDPPAEDTCGGPCPVGRYCQTGQLFSFLFFILTGLSRTPHC